VVGKSTRIYVAGHLGLVGSAIYRCLVGKGFENLIVRSHSQLDLTDQAITREFLQTENPEVVILAAAKVGGIHANSTYPAEFVRSNLAIQANVIHEAYEIGVKYLVFLGSSCIYPRNCPQPMQEKHLLTGELEPTNRPYALAKIVGIEMCWAYNRQHGTRYLAVMPTNAYGPGDNYDLNNAHVVPALIRKIHEAKKANKSSFEAWGSGEVWREFLYSDDLAESCVHLLNLPPEMLDYLFNDERPPLINVGSGVELTIRDLIEVISDVIGYRGEVIWDSTKPDGTPRKLLDGTQMEELNWRPRIDLARGVSLAYEDFLRQGD
jgi:GDP-L-fucose synthase